MQYIKKPSLLLLCSFIAMFMLALSATKPFYNWDMIMYVASAKSMEESDVSLLHAFTYHSVRQAVPVDIFQALTTGGIREEKFHDPSQLKDTLSFYQIRPLYNSAIYCLYKLNIDIVFATHIISGFFIALAMAVLYRIAIHNIQSPLVFFVPLLPLVFGTSDLARLSTPDGMAFFAFLLLAYLYMKHQILWVLILMPLVLTIRTDLVLFTLPLSLLILLFHKNCTPALASIFLSIATYILIGEMSDNRGWQNVFTATFDGDEPSSPLNKYEFITQVYLPIFLSNISKLIHDGLFLLCFFSFSLSTYNIAYYHRFKLKHISNYMRHSPAATLLLASLIFMIVHFILFPVAWIRFFSAPYVTGSICILILLDKHLPLTRKPQEAA